TLAPLLHGGDTLALAGSLGAGKTTFARALLKELGVKEEVPSPTFTLLQNYETKRFPLYHFDLYRLKSEAELDELGWDNRGDGVTIVEWPERAGSRLQGDVLSMVFRLEQDGRRQCVIEPRGNWTQRWKDAA